jgi:hypothetical protein
LKACNEDMLISRDYVMIFSTISANYRADLKDLIRSF